MNLLLLRSIITSPLFKYFVVLIVFLVVVFFAYQKGASDVQKEWDLERLNTAYEIAELKAAQNEKTTEVVIKYVDRVKTIKQKGDTIVTYVDRWITPEDNAACTLPYSFVRLHNLAVQNRVPESPIDHNAGTGTAADSTTRR